MPVTGSSQSFWMVLTALGQFLTVPGQFLTVPGQFLTIPGQFLRDHLQFLTVPGQFLMDLKVPKFKSLQFLQFPNALWEGISFEDESILKGGDDVMTQDYHYVFAVFSVERDALCCFGVWTFGSHLDLSF